MNDYEMMNQRIDQLRLELDRLNQKEQMIKQLKADVMDELLDTRRQIAKADKFWLTKQKGETYSTPVDYFNV